MTITRITDTWTRRHSPSTNGGVDEVGNGNGTRPAGARTSELTIILPTRNERDNVAPLLSRLGHALRGTRFEVVFVDDSDDGTAEEVERVARGCSFDVRVIHRTPGHRDGGLSGAVITGIRGAEAPWVCVMDADLQHPPEVIRGLVRRAKEADVDLVAASRFRTEADRPQGLSRARATVSRALIALARATLGGRIRDISDPLTGFFLVRREAVDLESLEPRGFKILLEIIGRTPGLRVAEIGFEFGKRNAGKSKASAAQVIHYLSQLWHIRFTSLFARFARFGLVGLSGLAVNTLAFWLFEQLAGVHYAMAAVLATQFSTLWNFVLTEAWVFRGRAFRRHPAIRVGGFFAMNNAALLIRVPLLIALVSVIGFGSVTANVISLLVIFMLRFAISDTWIWAHGEPRRRAQYDIHGIITVASDTRLPELERFRVPALLSAPTIDVRLGRVRRRSAEDRRDHANERITYREWPGNVGFAAEIVRADERVDILASRGLRLSPHVLYTNVVEPVLRWTFAAKGHALVHAACIAHRGEGFLITAQTDTGKTTTILKTLDNLPWSFLSDDLILMSPSGRLLTYPKPLTISRHTAHAVKSPLLSWFERAALVVQSRLHSRSGRRVGMALDRRGVPAATLNAIVQGIIPPPKYHVDRLVPGVDMALEARLQGLVIIQRGGNGHVTLEPDEAVEILLANCEDAYGFPPYEVIAPFLQRHNGTDLRAVERSIIEDALDGVPATLVRSETMDWWQRLPGVLGQVAEQQHQSSLPRLTPSDARLGTA
jgi:glycosyltransferase involved in cell wall biosynthesis